LKTVTELALFKWLFLIAWFKYLNMEKIDCEGRVDVFKVFFLNRWQEFFESKKKNNKDMGSIVDIFLPRTRGRPLTQHAATP
jgi:hypothetical protein